MIDSHCHLEMVSEKIPLGEVISNFKNEGGKGLITISSDKTSFDFLDQDFGSYNLPIFISAGFHPHEAKDYTQQVRDRIIQLSTKSNCLAIGEIGLDFFYDHSPKKEQEYCFRDQLELAMKSNLPIIIHTRDAEEDTLRIFDEYKYPHIIVHCFTGTIDFAKECWKRGYLTSFTGIISFKKADDLRSIVRECPKDLYMIETDSPFLAPVPMRGKTNQPCYLRHVAQCIASIRGNTYEEIVSESTQNFRRFFFDNFQKGFFI